MYTKTLLLCVSFLSICTADDSTPEIKDYFKNSLYDSSSLYISCLVKQFAVTSRHLDGVSLCYRSVNVFVYSACL